MTNNSSIKALEIKTSVLFNLYLAKIIVLSCFFSLVISLYLLIPVVTAQIFNPIAETVNSYRNTNQRSKSINVNTSRNCRS